MTVRMACECFRQTRTSQRSTLAPRRRLLGECDNLSAHQVCCLDGIALTTLLSEIQLARHVVGFVTAWKGRPVVEERRSESSRGYMVVDRRELVGLRPKRYRNIVYVYRHMSGSGKVRARGVDFLYV